MPPWPPGLLEAKYILSPSMLMAGWQSSNSLVLKGSRYVDHPRYRLIFLDSTKRWRCLPSLSTFTLPLMMTFREK